MAPALSKGKKQSIHKHSRATPRVWSPREVPKYFHSYLQKDNYDLEKRIANYHQFMKRYRIKHVRTIRKHPYLLMFRAGDHETYEYGDYPSWFDHSRAWLTHDGETIVTTEPYDAIDEPKVRAWAQTQGVEVTIHPMADSLHCPNRCYLIVLRKSSEPYTADPEAIEATALEFETIDQQVESEMEARNVLTEAFRPYVTREPKGRLLVRVGDRWFVKEKRWKGPANEALRTWAKRAHLWIKTKRGKRVVTATPRGCKSIVDFALIELKWKF